MNQNIKKIHLSIFRTFIQLIFFFLLPGLYANAFVGISVISQGLAERDFNLLRSFLQLISTLAVIPVTLLFGRFFCGWMCAFGTLGDLLYSLSSKVFHIKFRIDAEADHYLKYIKYALFLYILVVVWIIKAFKISSLSPWDAFGSLLTFTSLPDFSYVITEVSVGLLLLVAIILGSLFVERFFCRYFCPLGAVFAIISHIKFLRIKKPTDKCGSCKACTNKCSMGIPLYQMEHVASGECIECMKCVNVCPHENIQVTAITGATHPALTAALAVTAITGVYYISNFTYDTYLQNTAVTADTASLENTSIYADGTYQGSGTGFRGAATTVSVTIEGGIITDIKALSTGDDRQYFNTSFPSIINQMITSQSTEVDAVSGATFSSNGIIEAVTSALNKAMQAQP
jgi:polyferredoxin/major membrane immunogen (membrane-anchored lipoprotein)